MQCKLCILCNFGLLNGQLNLNYCISTWGGAPKSVLQPLITLQKKIVRIITFSSYDSHSEPIFNQLKILNLDKLYKLNLAIIIHKVFTNITPGSNNLILINKIHNYSTRLATSNNYYQTFNTSNLEQCYTNQGLKFWKLLPEEIKCLPLKVFKNRVKKYLFL